MNMRNYLIKKLNGIYRFMMHCFMVGSSSSGSEYNFDNHNEFMKQYEKDIEKTIKKEITAEIIIINAEQSKNIKENAHSQVLDIRIIHANSILRIYKTNFLQIKSNEKKILSIIKNIPNELDEEVDEIILKREYLEKLIYWTPFDGNFTKPKQMVGVIGYQGGRNT